MPDQVIYGVAYNTESYGYSPIGTPGPYESLNFGWAQVAPSVGSNPAPDTAYLYTAASGGAFSRQTGWTPYSGAVSFDTPVELTRFTAE